MLKADHSFREGEGLEPGRARDPMDDSPDSTVGTHGSDSQAPAPVYYTFNSSGPGEECRWRWFTGAHGHRAGRLVSVETAQGVERLQELFGLKRDGIVGPETFVLMRGIVERKG